jgi:hypothetical protein
MKKTLLVLLAAAGVSSAAFAQDFSYNAGDVLVGFRYTDQDFTKAYIVNLGQITTVANYTPSWEGINLSSDLVTVFGNNWATSTTWGILSFPQDRKSYSASSDVASGSASITTKVVAGLGTPLSRFASIGSQFNSLTQTTGDDANAGKLSQGVWGESSDLNWTDSVFNNYFAVGNFEAATSSNLDLYTAYGPTYGPTGDALRSTTPNVNTFSVQNGTIQSVPEPSTYALFGFAALLLIVAYRRANA